MIAAATVWSPSMSSSCLSFRPDSPQRLGADRGQPLDQRRRRVPAKVVDLLLGQGGEPGPLGVAAVPDPVPAKKYPNAGRALVLADHVREHIPDCPLGTVGRLR